MEYIYSRHDRILDLGFSPTLCWMIISSNVAVVAILLWKTVIKGEGVMGKSHPCLLREVVRRILSPVRTLVLWLGIFDSGLFLL